MWLLKRKPQQVKGDGVPRTHTLSALDPTNFCKNKDKPTLACNGQCVLMKKLKALDIEKKKSDSEQIKVSFLSFKFLHNIIFTVCNIFILVEKNTHFFDYNNYHFFFLSDIFTPPQS